MHEGEGEGETCVAMNHSPKQVAFLDAYHHDLKNMVAGAI